MATIEAIVIDPGEPARLVEIPDTLEALQGLVGGYIEGVFGEEAVIYVNEEGLLLNLPFNRTASLVARQFTGLGHVCFGPAVIVGPSDPDGNNTHVRPSVRNYCKLEK